MERNEMTIQRVTKVPNPAPKQEKFYVTRVKKKIVFFLL